MVQLTSPPRGLSLSHPVVLISTWFGSGLLPKAPGTWGSVAAMPFALLIWWTGGALWLALGGVLLFVAGIWASQQYALALGRDDPSEVVVDEVAALWLVLAALPVTPFNWFSGFLLFRLFDIVKPWPIGWADGRIKGGIGIMLDDVIAAFYTVLLFVAVDIAIASLT